MVLGSKLPGGLSLLEGKMLQIMSVGYCNLDLVRPSPTPFRLNENRKLIKKEHLQIITKQIYAKCTRFTFLSYSCCWWNSVLVEDSLKEDNHTFLVIVSVVRNRF